MNKTLDIFDNIDGVTDYLNDLYNKQGGGLNKIGAETLSKYNQKTTLLFDSIVHGLAVRSHNAIVTFINDSNQVHDQDDMDVDRHSAEAHIESLELTLRQLGWKDDAGSALKVKQAIVGAIDINHDDLENILNKALKLIDKIQNKYQVKA